MKLSRPALESLIRLLEAGETGALMDADIMQAVTSKCVGTERDPVSGALYVVKGVDYPPVREGLVRLAVRPITSTWDGAVAFVLNTLPGCFYCVGEMHNGPFATLVPPGEKPGFSPAITVYAVTCTVALTLATLKVHLGESE